ncbi:DUF4843 domain-containing protein [Pedobacter frigiditerrae]|uniref:DUF4843 domain-containing protein n=1 Tax=Pedobacter frigiditerrae TaxID=2530452 RepID=A0A4R0MLH5_9SPHI|nr:DUF4843 domain-containing protein [Pedobacter frigiditerrae]TCC87267.1 DUF4843 domain-containing protein [Pedobacter frigiditerrae]
MKKYIILIIVAITVLIGCKKNAAFTYESDDNVYLDYPNLDTITYSFSYKPSIEQDTVWIPVKISGIRVAKDRKFVMSVVEGSSSAVRGFHYEKLKDFYIIPKDSGVVKVPVIVKNIDTGLVSNSVSLTLRVEGGQDFKGELPAAKRTKTLTFSNRLEEPYWWKYWGQFRGYGRVKHEFFLIVNGNVNLADMSKPSTAFYDIPRTLYYIENVRLFVTYPFDWVKQNPTRGYELKLRTDNSGDYDFYNVNAPSKKFHLKYFKQADEYVFLDEKGNQIKM